MNAKNNCHSCFSQRKTRGRNESQFEECLTQKQPRSILTQSPDPDAPSPVSCSVLRAQVSLPHAYCFGTSPLTGLLLASALGNILPSAAAMGTSKLRETFSVEMTVFKTLELSCSLNGVFLPPWGVALRQRASASSQDAAVVPVDKQFVSQTKECNEYPSSKYLLWPVLY